MKDEQRYGPEPPSHPGKETTKEMGRDLLRTSSH